MSAVSRIQSQQNELIQSSDYVFLNPVEHAKALQILTSFVDGIKDIADLILQMNGKKINVIIVNQRTWDHESGYVLYASIPSKLTAKQLKKVIIASADAAIKCLNPKEQEWQRSVVLSYLKDSKIISTIICEFDAFDNHDVPGTIYVFEMKKGFGY